MAIILQAFAYNYILEDNAAAGTRNQPQTTNGYLAAEDQMLASSGLINPSPVLGRNINQRGAHNMMDVTNSIECICKSCFYAQNHTLARGRYKRGHTGVRQQEGCRL